jgi:hydrogenase maturation protease
VDVGTPGLDLTPYLLGADAVIFVDTVKAAGQPGEVRVYDRADILRHPPQARTGGHDPALKEALLTVDAVGGGPAFVSLVGVIPAWIAIGVVLSPAVEGAVERAVAAVALVVNGLGVTLKAAETRARARHLVGARVCEPEPIMRIKLGLAIVALLIWVVMFGAGTDIWHDTGRPDIWNRTDPPFNDIRALGVALYLLFPVLLAQLVFAVIDVYRSRSRSD